MPKQVTDVTQFLKIATTAKKCIISKSKKNHTKFKVRGSRFLYTLTVTDPTKAKKLKESLPAQLKVDEK